MEDTRKRKSDVVSGQAVNKKMKVMSLPPCTDSLVNYRIPELAQNRLAFLTFYASFNSKIAHIIPEAMADAQKEILFGTQHQSW